MEMEMESRVLFKEMDSKGGNPSASGLSFVSPSGQSSETEPETARIGGVFAYLMIRIPTLPSLF
ncbi:hypothetical protein COLO4_28967 [Corchorus olitorius]|uniref:Uncharacterized protein n=1 Tax=Corchorus olitorius TaxID=93759 RepID=A0A1R3HH54_9ROSI|nr:hypothetical protein COLO4_28967 [Corchorus olitorius]